MSVQPPAIALILARAGSKGVPGKNFAPIAGRPCVAWTLDYAAACGLLSAIAVSTDDPRIEELVESEYPGVEVVARPRDLASDTATVDDAARHAMRELESRRPELKTPETRVVILYANVPVRPAGLIERALDRMAHPGTDSVQSYQPVGKNHPWWMARVDRATGQVTPWEGDVLNHGVFRRQDLPPAFVPDGAILVVTRRALMLQIPGVAPGPHAFFGAIRLGIETKPGDVVDIDSPIDVAVADAVLRRATTVPS